MSEKSNWKRFIQVKPNKKALERRAAKAEKATLRHARKFLTGRWDNLREARRDVTAWLLLVAVLIAIGVMQMISYSSGFQTTAAVGGGTYAEGVTSKIATINPLYAETEAEHAASRLVYDGLLTYDSTNHLHGDLATAWSVSEDGKTYDVSLRKDVKWQDGQAFAADDVVFTVNMIKNPKAGSALYDSWRTISVAKISDSQVRFTLQNPYAPFPHALTFGILPAHALTDVPAETMREHVSGNTYVTGTGPFYLRSVQATGGEQSSWSFGANSAYFGGAPRVSTVQMRTYATSGDLTQAFTNGEINAAAGPILVDALATQQKTADTQLQQAPLDDGVFALFNMNGEATSDQSVREALRLGLNRDEVRKAVALGDGDSPEELNGPIVPGLFASVDELKQQAFDEAAAAKKLDDAGWKLNSSGMREKDGQKLRLHIVTVAGTDYEPAAKNLAEQWQNLGIDVDLDVASSDNVQQNYFIPRNYDVLVYQLQLGADADVFSYWHSSQAVASGLNFTNYKSVLVDASLVSGRTRMSSELREAKYQTFVETWLADVPAIALYRPNFYYLHTDNVRSIDNSPLVDATYRFGNVANWTVRTGQVNTTP